MLDFLKPIFPFAFAVVWFGVIVALYFCVRAKQREYFRQFPPVDGIPLDMYVSGSRAANRAIKRVMWQRQPDPLLERLRREIWRRLRYQIIWTFAFPPVTIAVIALLAVAGLVHPN